MAAHHKIHPEQFKLFMGGQEWQRSVSDSIDRVHTKGETMKAVWSEKLTESKVPGSYTTHGAGLHDAIATHGYQHDADDPPTVLLGNSGQKIQGEGHHRIAAAADIERATGRNVWIPTNYVKHPFR
jgi:hypothetical protein